MTAGVKSFLTLEVEVIPSVLAIVSYKLMEGGKQQDIEQFSEFAQSNCCP